MIEFLFKSCLGLAVPALDFKRCLGLAQGISDLQCTRVLLAGR